TDDVDLDAAVEGAVVACFANTGQLCISIERIYVARSIADAFVERLGRRAQSLRLGAEQAFGPEVGALASAAQLEKVRAHVDDAVAKGARLVAGGRHRPDVGPLFYEPTVLTDVTPEMDLYREETFGPVVAVYPVESDDEAIEQANDTEYGLNASVYCGDPARGRAIAERLLAGTVNVNDGYASAWGSVDAPMGGMKASGLGRRHGREGLLKYTESRTVAVRSKLAARLPGGLRPALHRPAAQGEAPAPLTRRGPRRVAPDLGRSPGERATRCSGTATGARPRLRGAGGAEVRGGSQLTDHSARTDRSSPRSAPRTPGDDPPARRWPRRAVLAGLAGTGTAAAAAATVRLRPTGDVAGAPPARRAASPLDGGGF